MKKKLVLLGTLLSLVFVLSGCTEYNQPITSESSGIWNEFFVYPLSWLITYIANFLGSEYGIAIIVVTILLRTALLPLMIKQTKSTKAMQVIQPGMKKLQEKYKSKDAVSQQKLQKETMELMQKYNVNPMMGCLPIFIQMPILMAIYHAINRTTEIAQHSFLWFDLGHPDSYYILPVLAAATTFLSQKISMSGMADNPQMKIMLYMMPIMILVMGIQFPAALGLYWVVGNVFTVFQTLLIKGPDLKANAAQKAAEKK